MKLVIVGTSLEQVMSARAMVEGSLNHLRRRSGLKPTSGVVKATYVDATRLAELRSLSECPWDLTRLIRLCEELNIAHANDCHITTAMLVRTIVNHVPPVFACKNFGEVANNYGGTKSFKGSMQHLNQSLRNIADAQLHEHVRSSETVPYEAQVDFRQDLAVLLSEVVRLLKSPAKG